MAHVISASNPAVGFYRGLQANLESLASNGGYRDGAFYITTDTDRLYYAQSSSELVYLNKSIQIVTAFPASGQLAGEFYYNTSTQQLAYYNGTGWVHVNYYTDTRVGSITVSDATADNTGLTFSLSLQHHDKNGQVTGSALTDTFKITKEQINDLVIHPAIPDLGDIQVTLNATVATNKATVALGGKGAHASDNSFTIQGSTGVTIQGNDDAIIIKGTTYSLTNDNEAKIVLKDNDDAVKGSVTFSDDDKDIIITATNGNINVSHKTYSGTSKEATVASGAVDFGQELTILKGVQVSNGHVTGVTTSKITLPAKPEEKYATGIAADNAGKITVTMTDGSTFSSGTDLYYIINGKTRYNQADLTEDVKDIIEENLTKLSNAMTFKGSLTGGSPAVAISTLVTSAAVGDVYIVKSGSITVPGNDPDGDTIATTGDLIIANGVEANGVITGDIQWIVIEGTEIDTTYLLNANNNKIVLSEDGGKDVSTITLADDDKVILTSVNNTITAEHAQITTAANTGTAQTLANGGTFNVVTKMTNDGYGHVTGVETTAITLPTIADQTNDHTLVGNQTNKTVTLQNSEAENRGSIKFANGTATSAVVTVNGNDSTITFNHDNITRSDTNNTAATNLTAGTTFDVVIDVDSDAQGHITKMTTQKYKAVDTQYKLGKAKTDVNAEGSAKVEVASNIATVTDYLYTTDGAAAGSSSFKVGASATSNLQVTASSNQINLGLVWGTF